MINNILIPVHLSEIIAPHLTYALSLAKKFDAKLTLLQTYPMYHETLSTEHSGASAAPIEPFDEDKIRENTEKELSKISEMQGLDYELIVLPGSEKTLISNMHEELDADLLVLNCEESSDFEAFFGSKAEMVSGKAQSSILIVPDDFEYKAYEKIGLALDEGETKDDVSIDDLLPFIKHYGATLEAFHLTEKKLDELTEAEREIYYSLKQKMIDKDITNFNYQTIIERDITEGIKQFIDDQNIDLLVLLYRDHGFFKRLFNPGIRKQMIRNAGIPVLIIK